MTEFISLTDGDKLLVHRNDEGEVYKIELINLDGRLIESWQFGLGESAAEVIERFS